MSISRKEIEHIALSARLQLSEEETDTYSEQLNFILEWTEKLNHLDVSEVEPTTHVFSMSNVFREDKVTESLTVEKALANAPEAEGTLFRVPKIV